MSQQCPGRRSSPPFSATIAENIDGVSVRTEMLEVVAQAAGPIWKETLPDMAGNRRLRRDLYARGVTDLHNHETLRQLNATRYMLATPLSRYLQAPESDGRARCQARDLWRHCRSS